MDESETKHPHTMFTAMYSAEYKAKVSGTINDAIVKAWTRHQYIRDLIHTPVLLFIRDHPELDEVDVHALEWVRNASTLEDAHEPYYVVPI